MMRIGNLLPRIFGMSVLCLAAMLSISCGGGGPVLTLEVMPYDDADMHLQWVDPFTTEDGYEIWRDDGSGGDFAQIGTTPPDYFGYDDTTFTTGLTYKYYIIAYQGTTDLAQSNTVSIEARAPYVTVLTPPNGANLTLGDMYDISWVSNVPDFDARIYLSIDGHVWPADYQLLYSWAPNGSPWPWKVGYANMEEDPTKPPVWAQAVNNTQTNCSIIITHYHAVGASGWSNGTFTITVP